MHQFRLQIWVPALAITLLVAFCGSGSGAPAVASDPIFIGWSNLLPAWAYTFTPNSQNACTAGKPSCVKQTLASMNRRFAPLAKSCDHSAVFSLAYLITTQAYASTAAKAHAFDDVAWVNHEDAVFAQFYFQAYDSYAQGHLAQVPQAWQIAFNAAKSRTVTGLGDLLLGMNAHVNRDLPFVLAGIGLVAPDGSSRKPDHDRINKMLNGVVEKILTEEAQQFDYTIDDAGTPYGISYTALLQLLVAWRETAWRNAERLVAAPNATAQAAVAQQIEAYAATTARGIVLFDMYTPPVSSSAARDAYCASHAH